MKIVQNPSSYICIQDEQETLLSEPSKALERWKNDFQVLPNEIGEEEKIIKKLRFYGFF